MKLSIDEKIKELGIKRILIADDTKENINAAKEYFGNEIVKYGVSVTYVNSGKGAENEIIKAKKSNKKFDLVITDLDMEEEKAGINVFYEAWLYGSPCLIATGKTGYVGNNYGMSQAEIMEKGLSGHGDTINYYGLPVYDDEYIIKSRDGSSSNSKKEIEGWKHTFFHALNYLSRFKSEEIPEFKRNFFEGIVRPNQLPLDGFQKKCLDFLKNEFNTDFDL